MTDQTLFNDEDFEDVDRRFLKESLKKCFTRLKEDEINNFVDKMILDGLNEELVSAVSLENLLELGFNKYQGQALVKHWASEATKPDATVDFHKEQVVPEHNTEPRPSTSQQGQTFIATSQQGQTFIELSEFKINWDLIYQVEHNGQTAGEVIRKKEAMSPKLRSKVASEVVRQAARVKNLTRESFDTIHSRLIMTKHSDSFQEVLASGAKSPGGFLYMLKYHFDNRKRPDRNQNLRQRDFMIRHFEQPRGKFSYGCVRWRVKDGKPGQTELTVQEQKARMIKEYKQVRPKFWDWNKIEEMLDNTYKAQRDLINANITAALEEQKKQTAQKRKKKSNTADDSDPDGDLQENHRHVTISKVAEEWPFLFTYEGLLIHFRTLTEVDIEVELAKFNSGLEKEVLMDFFTKKDKVDDRFYADTIKAMEKAKKKKPEVNYELQAIIMMLQRHFKEQGPCIFETTEETATMEIILEQRKAPQYPMLTAPAKGDCIFKAKSLFLGVDGDFHHSFKASLFEKAACSVFMMYFVFNIDYAPDSQITLEFLQRYVFHMDPPQGNKRPTRGKRSTAKQVKYSTKIIHDDVARLVNKLKAAQRARETDNTQSSGEDSASSGNITDNENYVPF